MREWQGVYGGRKLRGCGKARNLSGKFGFYFGVWDGRTLIDKKARKENIFFAIFNVKNVLILLPGLFTTYCTTISMNMVLTPITGYCVGGKRKDRASDYIRLSIKFNVIV